MTIKNAIICATTALSIAAGSVAVPMTAQAAPFAKFSNQIETEAAGVEEVGRRGRRYRRWRGRGRRGVNPGAAAAIGIGAFALGAAIAAGAANSCRTVYVERWSPRRGAYVVRRETVC
ncbi:MAG: hypothetical protein AAGB11_18880 [Pseudomonadota bacterium]